MTQTMNFNPAPAGTFTRQILIYGPTLYRRLSPVMYVDGQTPPCLLLHGDADTTVPGVGHGWFNHDPHFAPCLERMEAFFLAHLA